MNVQTLSISSLRNLLERGLVVFLAAFLTWGIAQAATKPAQLPLLSVATGANPNVMLSVDNSGSMLAAYLDSYKFKAQSTAPTTTTEYHTFTCSGSGYTGPYRDEEGDYYCLSTVVKDACPYGFTGPKTRGDGSKYCEREEPVYSCPAGFTGPTNDPVNGGQICSQVRYTYSCSDAAYGIVGTTDSNRTCTRSWKEYSCPATGYTGPALVGGVQKCTPNTVTYSCNWDAKLGTGSDANKCFNYSCKSGTLKQKDGIANCRSGNAFFGYTWNPSSLVASAAATSLATATPPLINATATDKTDSNASLIVPEPYNYYQAPTSTLVTNQYDNVEESVKDTRFYATSPTYSSGVVRASSRTAVGGVAIKGGDYYAMRSAQVNPLYYDPNKTYAPRVNYTGTGNYEALPTGFIKDEGIGKEVNWNLNNTPLNYPYGNTDIYYPNLTKTTTPSTTDKFVYVICSTYNASTCTVQKTATQVVEITKDTLSVNLPVGNSRTDCGSVPATTCTGAEERQNILNWYTYYQTRADITATSLGFALANAAYSGKMRVGFYNIDRYVSNSDYVNKPGTKWDGSQTLTVNSKNYPLAKGVRPFELGSTVGNTTNTKPIFDWLYSQKTITAGGTPLHDAIEQVGKYYQSEEPWYKNPTDSTSDKLTCRRAYNILFSDGAWTPNKKINTGSVPYNSAALTPKTTAGANAVLAPAFSYSRNGDTYNLGSYIAYPDAGAGYSQSLAAITSQYYWGLDLKSNIANELTTRPGEPTSWQNMKTYTIGYGIAPTGFYYDDIKSWEKSFVKLGYQSDLVPNWPTETLLSMSSSSNPAAKNEEAARIDDFIHAGYTGGGASYSVRTADEIQRAFDLVLSDVVSASGNDAGVAVSGASSSVSTIEGSLKYTVDYKTLDNSGDVKAWKLDANGSNASVNAMWSAKNNMPRAANRNLSTLSSTDGAVVLSHATTLTSLPDDIKALLNNGNTNLATDASFIKYLRGEDGITDPDGDVYRRRTSLIGASVNAPPAYIGGRLNMGYDRGMSGVDGKSDYATFTNDKGKVPGTLYAPTNDGQVHVINAADDSATPSQKIKNSSGGVIAAGTELWAYQIRGSLSKMQAFADPAYNFEYVLDGPVAEHDIYDSTTGVNAWRQMVYGTLGRAGKGIYALNAPLNKADANNLNRIPNASGYKWEVAPANMGYITNASTAGQTRSGDWVVLVNSGHYANTTKAGLFVLNALTGATIKFIELPTGYAFGRGLGGVTAIRDASRRIVGAYAGDDGGNLWRFDLLGATSASWGVSYNQPLFTAPANQPIYVAPAWVPHPGDGKALPDGCVNNRTAQDLANNDYAQQCGAMVIFGTGALLDADDKLNTNMQTIYGIWDKTPIGLPITPAFVAVSKTTNLLKQTIDTVATTGSGLSADKTFFKVSSNAIDWNTQRGWYLDLSKLPNSTGERVIGDVFNLGSNVFVSSVVVNNAASVDEETCTVKASPPNFLYGLDALTGGLKRAFDQNGDGKADQFSVAYIPGGGFTRGSVITQTTKEGSSSTAGLGLPTEGDPDLAIKNKCTGEQGFDTGITGSMQVFDGCPAGWNRSWRQILVPPVF